MPSGRLTKSHLAALQPGQAVTFQQYDPDSGHWEERRGVIGHVPLPAEHPQVCSWGSNGAPYFGLFTDEHPGEVLLVDEHEITAVLSPADPAQKERLAAWLASRRPAALRRQRAELASQLAEVWMQSASRQPAEGVSAVPYTSDRGPAYKILGANGQRVGEFLLPHGPLRMRVEALRGPASAVLAAHGVPVPGVSLHRPFANAGCVVRSDDRWTIHPVISGDLVDGIELGLYIPSERTVVSRYVELGDLLRELILRQGQAVETLRHSPDRTVEPLGEAITGLMRQRAEADADIAALRTMLGEPPTPDHWPFAPSRPQTSSPTRNLDARGAKGSDRRGSKRTHRRVGHDRLVVGYRYGGGVGMSLHK